MRKKTVAKGQAKERGKTLPPQNATEKMTTSQKIQWWNAKCEEGMPKVSTPKGTGWSSSKDGQNPLMTAAPIEQEQVPAAKTQTVDAATQRDAWEPEPNASEAPKESAVTVATQWPPRKSPPQSLPPMLTRRPDEEKANDKKEVIDCPEIIAWITDMDPGEA